MRFEGVIRTWDDERGFGFIEPVLGGQEIFVHVKAFPRGAARPTVGQRVSFEVEVESRGRKRACRVQPVRPASLRMKQQRDSPAQWGFATLLAIPAFLVLYLVIGILWRPPSWFGLLYLAISILTYLAYGVDKAAARKGAWRISESALHGLSLAGGWPGALLAQQLLRHKSSKRQFRTAFWATVAANVVAFVFVCSPIGAPLWAAW